MFTQLETRNESEFTVLYTLKLNVTHKYQVQILILVGKHHYFECCINTIDMK